MAAEGGGDRIRVGQSIEAYHLLRKHLLLAEVVEEHPARDVLGDEMELRRRLEGALEPEDEGVAHLEMCAGGGGGREVWRACLT